MSVTKDAKLYCANNLVVMVIEYLVQGFPNVPRDKLVSNFMKSRTCASLYDLKTHLWAEGPAYILGLYEEELGVTFEWLPD